MKRAALLFSSLCFLANIIVAQSGPGGVGSSTSTSDSLLLWLRADSLVSVDGSNFVTSWGDISGNGNDYTTQDGAQFPFNATGLNSRPTIDFTEANAVIGELEGSSTATYFGLNSNAPVRSGDVIIIFQNGTNSGYISQFPASGGNSSFLSMVSQGGNGGAADNNEPDDIQVFVRNNGADSDTFDEISSQGSAADNLFVDDQFHIARFGFDLVGDSIWLYHNSTYAGSVSVPDIAYDGTNTGSGTHRLGSSDTGQDYDGEIAEFIVFTDILSDAQYTVLLNYLSARYNLTISNDFYVGTGFLEDVIGIGNEGSSDHMATTGAGGGLYLSGSTGTSTTTFDSDEWIFAGHNGVESTNTFADVPDAGKTRLNRVWKLEKTEGASNAGFDVTITFDLGELNLIEYPGLVLYKRTATTGDFTNLGLTPSVSGDQISFTLTDANTDDAEQYFTIAYDAPTPGGVGTNLALWLQANSGVNTTGTAVDSWEDQGLGANDAADPSALAELTTNSTNFNPGIVFNSDATSLEGTVTTSASNFTFFTVYEDISGANSGLALFGFNSGQSHPLYDNSYAGGGAFSSNITKDRTALLTVDHPSGTSANIYQDGASFESSYTTTGNSAAGTYNYTLGDDDDGSNEFTGTLNELIAYEGTLTTGEREQVESYLAIKYGISLSHDYVSSDGTLIFDLDNSALNDGYENDVAGIGADITTGLNQKISKGVQDSLVISTENDFTSLNTNNSTPLSDDSFFLVSNNGSDFGTMTIDGRERLNRVWKVSESGTVGTVFMGLPNSLDDFGSMLVSTDPTFSTGVTEVFASENGSYSSVNHDFSSGDYFTFTVKQTLGSGNDDLLVWLRADQGVTTSGSNVTLWADQSRYGNDANDDDTEFDEETSLAVQAEDPVSFNSEGFNFNPTISSNGADRPLTGSYTSTEEAMTFFIVGREEDVASDNHAWFDTYDDNGPGTGAVYRSYLFEELYNNGADFAESLNEDTTTIYTIEHPSSSIVDIYENGFLFQDDYTADNTHPAGVHHYVIADDATGGNEFIGQIAEVMFYQGALTSTERQSIQSYLAVKYGITLLDDYVATDGTVLLDISADGNFDHNISALGRNDLLQLDQKVSKSEFGNLVIATTQDFENSNASRSTSLSNDQYFFTSSNLGSLASDSSYRSFTGNRLGRKWKANETNNPGSVYVAISDTVAANFNVLIVSTDSTFSSGVTEVPLEQSGGFYYVTRDFTSGEYFTFANSVSPGGVGEDLLVWLKADSDLTVSDWTDQSGNGNNATSPENDPSIDIDGMNFNPTIDFTTAGVRMQGTVTTTSSDLSYLIVAEDRSGASSGGVLLEFDAATDLTLDDGSYAGLSFTSPANINKNADQVISTTHSGSTATVYLDGTSFETGATNAAATTTYTYAIGDDVASGNGFDGSISEVIVYDDVLTDGEREMLQSYLAVKYALPIQHDITASDGSVVLDATESAGYLNNLFGLGYDVRTQLDQKVATSSGGSLLMATTDDFTTENTARATAFNDLQYSLITNDGGALTITSDYKAESNVRLDRVWEVHELNNPGTVVLALPNSGGFTSLNTILVSSDPTFTTGVTEQSLTVSGGFLTISIDLTDGQYFTFTTAEPESSIWYSYLSGNWSDPANWTLDGAISPLYLNPSSEIPSEGDTVVVRSGRTITADLNGIVVERTEILGNLDLVSTSGHDFTYILGNGTLQLSGASGVDNYPSGIDTLFYSSTEGGTVEYSGTGLTLNTNRRYNNLRVNLDASPNEIIQTADSIWIFGNMTITQGVYHFGDNSVADDEVAEVRGDVLIETNGGIQVGATNSRHEFNLYGDFTNQGNVEFTNRTSADIENEATDGIVDVNFVSATQDQTVDLQNTTIFYRIEINKGVDDTYKVSLSADNASYFALYGFSDEGHGSVAQLTANNNAIGLIYGTIELGNNIQVNELTDDGTYNISEGAAIEIDGGSLTGSDWIVTYGSLIINAGTLDLGIGTVLRNSGFWEVHGGTVNMGHFRTSALGAGNDGSWTQTGGIVNLTGSTAQNEYYTFSLTYEECSFTMTGGQLNLTIDNDALDGLKGIFLNSAPENTSVTGGTVTIDQAHTETDSLLITSTVPFYNLTLRQSVANANPNAYFIVSGGNSGGTAPDGVTLTGNTLQVLNDFTIDNADGNTTTVDFDGNNVEVTGNLVIQSGAVTDFTDMTLIMNGIGSSDLDIQLASTLVLDSLEINKNDGVNVNIINGQSTAIQVDNYLNVVGGNFNIDTYDVTANGNINIADTIGTSTSTGHIYMNGGGVQNVTSTTGSIYDLIVDNSNGVSLTGDMGVDTLDLNAGVFDINTSNLTLNSEVQTSGTFGTTLMIQTDGNASDGGLGYYFDGANANPASILYPIGTDANATTRYTPATMDLSGVVDDGFVSISLADAELLTTDQSGGNILSYYWRSNNQSFGTAPTVQYTFTYDASDDDATDEANYVPGKVLDESPFTRSSEIQANLNTTTNVITFDNDGGGGFSLENANYTAGVAARFIGAPTVYYSRRHQIGGGGQTWSDTNDWSTDAVLQHGGAAAASVPGVGDVVVIGAGQINGSDEANDTGLANTTARHQMVAQASRTVAEVIFASNPAGTALGNNLSRIRLNNTAFDLTAGKIGGHGELMISVSNSDESVVTADLGDFVEADTSSVFYDVRSGGSVVISNLTEFPGIRIFGNDNDPDVSFANDITAASILIDRSSNLELRSNITVSGDVRVGNNQEGHLTFPDDGSNYTLSVGNDLIATSNDPNTITTENAGTDVHTVSVGGNIDLDASSINSFDLTSAAGAQVILELSGEGDHSFDNDAGVTVNLYRLEMNKGSDTTNTFTVNTDFSLSGSNTVSPQSLELQNGKLILNNSSINIELADNSDFAIPSTAGLEVTQGTVTSTGANVILGGLLRINGGTATLASTDVEYTSTGTALLDVTSGTLNVGGQVRRSLTSSNGVLKYRQSGGDVDIATDVADNNTRAAFEVLNTGSEFTLTGGTFNIERGVTGDANVSLRLGPTTSDIAGSTISIFENLGADYGSNFFNLSSTIPLNNLTISNSIDLPDVQLYTQNLEVNDLIINSNQALLANNFNLTVNGDFTNNGTYTNNATETIFAGSGAQSISGSGTYTIYDLRKNGSGITTSSVSLDVDHDLILTSGTLDVGANSVDIGNDALIQGTFTNTGGDGLVFSGTANQELSGLTNNTIDIGTITISNSNGVDIPDGNGYNFNITQELKLNAGVFNIGGSLVTLTAGSTISTTSTFSVNNMVQTNSSFTDNGLSIEFFTVDADTTILFPVGELKYTPVTFNLDQGTSGGTLRVRPANEIHPSISDDGGTGVDETQQVLQYYWIVNASDLVINDVGSDLSNTAVFEYDHDDVRVESTDTTQYESARLLTGSSNWDKSYGTDNFLGASRSFVVELVDGYTSAEIAGDYTAGLGSAIPDMVPQYSSNFGGEGNYNDDASWLPADLSSGLGPVGAQITVSSGDTVVLNVSNIRLTSTVIEAGGFIRVPAGVTNIRLGTVSGSGTIILEDNELLPTGEYSSFLACDGGALQYSGTTTYSVLSGISQIRKVIFEGSGTRTMPNNLLTVCDTLEINGPTVAFSSGLVYAIGDADTDRLDIQSGTITLSNGSTINLTGDFNMAGGSFTGSTNTDLNITDDVSLSGGTLNWNGTDVALNGSSEQLVDGAFTGSAGFDDLTINNSGSGVTLNSGDVEVTGTLNLTDGLVNTTASETLTLTSSGDWSGASSASYITGPLSKEDISATSTYQFPVGKSARYAPAYVVNVGVGGDDWTAEYFTSTSATYPNSSFDNTDPGSGFNALISVQATDRWEITSVGSNTAQVRTTYGSHTGFSNTDDIRLVWWDDEPTLDGDAAQNRWENQGGQVSGTASSGTVTSENAVFFSTRQFAMGRAPESTLPVELLEFVAEAVENKVKLSWSTASEVNNDYFEVLHSIDGVNFSAIGKVEGNGTTNEMISYTLTHKNPSLGTNYYQLKQVDYDGAEVLYDIIQVYNDYHQATMDITVYPNPATNENLRLRISSGDSHTPISVSIIDLNGKVHYNRVLNGALNIDERINPDLRMIPGIYYMIIKQGDQIERSKVIIK